MTEPASSAAGLVVIKLGMALGAGALGAVVMAAVDPPATRAAMFKQALVAGVCAIMGTPVAVRMLDFWFESINLANASVFDALEVVLPVGFIIGALSWGIVGAIVKLRQVISERGSDRLVAKLGLMLDARDARDVVLEDAKVASVELLQTAKDAKEALL